MENTAGAAGVTFPREKRLLAMCPHVSARLPLGRAKFDIEDFREYLAKN